MVVRKTCIGGEGMVASRQLMLSRDCLHAFHICTRRLPRLAVIHLVMDNN